MADRAVLKEIAAEITVGLLSITPGASTIVKLLPDTTKRTVRAAFGVEEAGSLKRAVHQALNAVTDDILAKLQAKPGSHEYGATFSAILDFRDALAVTKLDARLIATALAEPKLLEDAIRRNCPTEHAKSASELRRKVFKTVIERFTLAILAIAPQVPSVCLAVAVETYRQVRELRSLIEAKPDGAGPGAEADRPRD
jgi:hypothetical protein